MMLEALLAESEKEGWAAGSGSIEHARFQARILGMTEVPTRRGDPTVTTLRPVDGRNAHVNSLSAKYGKGDQPLHSDGAHMIRPPDVIVLACLGTSTVPTRLWRSKYLHFLSQDHIRHGIFLVENGKESFFSAAYSHSRLRYDPGCMVPCDARAREAARYFDEAIKSAVDHSWSQPGTVLVIDNRHALHARASAIEEPDREIQRVSFYLKQAQS